MLTLTSTKPDSYNINYYYSKYKNCYALGMNETKPESFWILPAEVQPTTCDIGAKNKIHYFMIPKQPIYTTCLCSKYHTNFTSQFYKIKATTLSSPTVSSSIDIFLTISNKYFNSITNKFPASPISKPQLSQLFNSP